MKFRRMVVGGVGPVALAAAIGVLPPSVAWGQAVSGSQISGVVRDASGGVLPGVTVTAANTDTGLERTVFTTGEGAYVLPNLPVGPYKLTVALTGFTTYTQTGIVLQVNSNPTINVTLSVGGVGEEVNVVAAATMVDTRGTSVGQLIEEKQIVNLPLNGRQPTQLILLSGAAVVTTSGGLVGDRRQYPSSVSISVAGGTGNGTSYLVDGGYNNDPLANISQPFPFPDALQEFKVENGVRPARYGILPGATVNAVTKSGTNAFHGALFEFYRDHRFNAIRPFTTTDDGLNRNQWGGTIGGPIVRNRAFFFGGVQFTRLRVNPTDTTSFVPSAKMRAGDFTDAASAACNAGNALTLPAPFVNNKVDPALFSPVAVNLLKYLPISNDPCGRIAFKVPDNSDEQLAVGRVDWQVSDKPTAVRPLLPRQLRSRAALRRHEPADDDGQRARARQPRADGRRRPRLVDVEQPVQLDAGGVREEPGPPAPGRVAVHLEGPRLEDHADGHRSRDERSPSPRSPTATRRPRSRAGSNR